MPQGGEQLVSRTAPPPLEGGDERLEPSICGRNANMRLFHKVAHLLLVIVLYKHEGNYAKVV